MKQRLYRIEAAGILFAMLTILFSFQRQFSFGKFGANSRQVPSLMHHEQPETLQNTVIDINNAFAEDFIPSENKNEIISETQEVPYFDNGVNETNIEQANSTEISVEKLLLIGIFSTAKAEKRRNLLRKLYSSFGNISSIDIYFILGSYSSETTDLSNEQEKHKDILFLDIKENMNKGLSFANAGKTFHFLNTFMRIHR